MVQESPSKLSVQLRIAEDSACLRIADDGQGFEREGALSSRTGHFGLIGMRERAERMGGEFKLTCRPCEGTEIKVSVPIK